MGAARDPATISLHAAVKIRSMTTSLFGTELARFELAGTHRIGLQSLLRSEMSTMTVEGCRGMTVALRHSF